MTDEQWEDIKRREKELEDDGLAGFIPRVRELLKLGATFWIPFGIPLLIPSVICRFRAIT